MPCHRLDGSYIRFYLSHELARNQDHTNKEVKTKGSDPLNSIQYFGVRLVVVSVPRIVMPDWDR